MSFSQIVQNALFLLPCKKKRENCYPEFAILISTNLTKYSKSDREVKIRKLLLLKERLNQILYNLRLQDHLQGFLGQALITRLLLFLLTYACLKSTKY